MTIFFGPEIPIDPFKMEFIKSAIADTMRDRSPICEVFQVLNEAMISLLKEHTELALKEKPKAILLAYFFDNLTQDEIAYRFGISQSTVHHSIYGKQVGHKARGSIKTLYDSITKDKRYMEIQNLIDEAKQLMATGHVLDRGGETEILAAWLASAMQGAKPEQFALRMWYMALFIGADGQSVSTATGVEILGFKMFHGYLNQAIMAGLLQWTNENTLKFVLDIRPKGAKKEAQ
jgi:predicted DNA-binding protein YlxM (UPF0122 family)